MPAAGKKIARKATSKSTAKADTRSSAKTVARSSAKTVARNTAQRSTKRKAGQVSGTTRGKKPIAAAKSIDRARTSAKTSRRSKIASATPLFYRLHALLETVRTIAQYEDQLCSLAHEAQSAGALTPEATEELHALLLDLPASSYHAELDALHETLHGLEKTAAAA